MKKTITVNEKVIINANGELHGRRCKPVICIDTGEVYSSCTDAAKANKTHVSVVSACCIGRIKTANGKHFCFVSKANENLEALTARIRELESKAAKWDVLEAEREEEERKENEARLAKEKHEREIAKAKEKIERCKAKCELRKEKFQNAITALADAEMELNALLNDNGNEEVCA